MEFNENNFKSVFKKNITDYLNEKKLLNQKYKTLFFSLRDFELDSEDNITFSEMVRKETKWMFK